MKKTVFLLMFLNFSAFAEPRFRERHPPVCHQGAVMGCVQKYQGALQRAHELANGLDPRLQGISGSLAILEKNLSSLEAEKKSFMIELTLLRDELDFLRAKKETGQSSLLSSLLSLEDFFNMHPLHRNWGERYPVQRAENLSAHLDEAGKKEADLIARITRSETEKTKLSNEYQSVLSQKNSWLAEAHGYYGMINRGCRAQLCPSDN